MSLTSAAICGVLCLASVLSIAVTDRLARRRRVRARLMMLQHDAEHAWFAEQAEAGSFHGRKG